MTRKERSNIEDSVTKIRNIIYDLQADANFPDELHSYCRNMTREIDKLLYVVKQ
jgi:hypothetical protein